MKYFPHTDDDIRQMLDAIGVKSLDELYAEVPDELKLHRELNIPSAISEIEVRKIINDLAADNKPLVPFAGAGAYDRTRSATTCACWLRVPAAVWPSSTCRPASRDRRSCRVR